MVSSYIFENIFIVDTVSFASEKLTFFSSLEISESNDLTSGRTFWLKERLKVFIKCAMHCSRSWRCRDELDSRQTWPLLSQNILVGMKECICLVHPEIDKHLEERSK